MALFFQIYFLLTSIDSCIRPSSFLLAIIFCFHECFQYLRVNSVENITKIEFFYKKFEFSKKLTETLISYFELKFFHPYLSIVLFLYNLCQKIYIYTD